STASYVGRGFRPGTCQQRHVPDAADNNNGFSGESANMHYAHKITRISVLAVGIAGALACGNADAAAFQLKENSAKGLGRAFAGSTSAEGDASVIATNPASMRLLDGRPFQADLSAISFSAGFEHFGARHNGAAGPGTGGTDRK